MIINESQKRYLLIISFTLISAWLIYNFINHKDNFWNLTGFTFGLIGLVFTIEDKRNIKITKAFDDISLAIKEEKVELKAEMQSRDLGHDQRLIELATKVAFVEHQLQLHRDQFGHERMIEELFDFQNKTGDRISELNANVALLSQQARIAHQIDKMKIDIEAINTKQQLLESQSSE